jgi:hypothetical protein
MNRLQFWVFTASAVVVAILAVADLVMAGQVQALNHEAALLERAVPDGERAAQLSRQIATRVYQLSAQDPGLRQLMVREQIIVQNSPPPARQNAAPAVGTPSAH